MHPLTLFSSLFAIAILSWINTAAAANPPTQAAPSSQIVIVGGGQPLSNEQMQLQLKTQELQLEQQILQIKQRLLQLQQQQTVQKQTVQTPLDLHWLDAKSGDVPANAIVAATANNKSVYICRAVYLQATQPGQLTDKGCLITYGGKALVQPDYQVLTGKQAVIWKGATALLPFLRPLPPYLGMAVSDNAGVPVQGGYEPDHPLYICRAMYGDNIHVGKVFGDGQQCNIGVDGAEVHVNSYEALFS